MTKQIDIGASISSRTDASSTVENIFSAEEFPCTLNIQNHTVARLVLPELKALDIPGLGSIDARFNDIGVLKRVVSSLAQISRLNHFSTMATIRLPGDLGDQDAQETETLSETENKPDALQSGEAGASTDVLSTGVATSTQDPEQAQATVIEELPGGVLLVAVDGTQFEVKKNQLRENGTLTAGGITAYQAAKKYN